MKKINEMRSNEEVEVEATRIIESILSEITGINEKLSPMLAGNEEAIKIVNEILTISEKVVSNMKYNDFAFYGIETLKALLKGTTLIKAYPEFSPKHKAGIQAIIGNL